MLCMSESADLLGNDAVELNHEEVCGPQHVRTYTLYYAHPLVGSGLMTGSIEHESIL